MSLSPDPNSPGLWMNPQWSDKTPGTFAVVIGVSAYDYLAGGSGPTAPTTYNLGQLTVSALTAFRFFEWLQNAYSVAGCPLARCWLLVSPTREEQAIAPGLGNH